MSPGIKVRALPSTIRTVARLPCHLQADPCDIHGCQALQGLLEVESSEKTPRWPRRTIVVLGISMRTFVSARPVLVPREISVPLSRSMSRALVPQLHSL